MQPTLLQPYFNNPDWIRTTTQSQAEHLFSSAIARELSAAFDQHTVSFPLTFVRPFILRLRDTRVHLSWSPGRLGGPATMALHNNEQLFATWVITAMMDHFHPLQTLLESRVVQVDLLITIDQVRLGFRWDSRNCNLRKTFIPYLRSEAM